MNMVTLNINKLKDLYYTNLIHEINKAKDKLAIFQIKYSSDFLSYEKKIKKASREDFERWDDYMEWKAFYKSYNTLIAEKRDFELRKNVSN